MNCEQCKEEVFELIEREPADPVGVREILDRCPDCRALFNEMKVALVAMDQLPLEDPPAHVDAEVLRAAATRRTKGTPLRKWRLQAPPWAMAAIAVLAVGVGVWSIPRSDELEGEEVLGAAAAESEEDILAEQEPASAPAALGEATGDKGEPKLQLDQKKQVQPRAEAPAKSSFARRERAQAKRKAVASEVRQVNAPEAAPTEAFAADAVAGLEAVDEPVGDSRAAGAATPAALAAEASDEEAKEDRDDAAEACRKTVADFEKHKRQDEDYEPGPEQQLTLGRCFAKRGDTKRARAWLERAATHPKTKVRAQKALKKLAPD